MAAPAATSEGLSGMNRVVSPGSTIGVLGSGQLGRMFAIAARRMGYRVHVLSPDDDTPTGQVADVEVQAAYTDQDAVARFAQAVDVVSFEFENVPLETIEVVERFVPVRPKGEVLYTTQNRLREKTFLHEAGFPVTPFRAVRAEVDVREGVRDLGTPAILKTAAWGYDGKGQRVVQAGDDPLACWDELQRVEAILESFVDFDIELSVVVARGLDGQCRHYAPFRNVHRNQILDLSSSPADLPPHVEQDAVEIARSLMDKLDMVGVLCVEFFLTRRNELLINELAPRPHNSGHLTIDAHVTCQFEQQVRSVCGLPLGSTRQLRPAAMGNLLGDCWQDGAPHWAGTCAYPEVKLHLYGKAQPKPGRKMGHLTALGDTPQDALAMVQEARVALRGVGQPYRVGTV
jgi:5-(carboxyamino)imidazole ribonucleotide synthase